MSKPHPTLRFFFGLALCVVGALLFVEVLNFLLPFDRFNARPFDRLAWAAGDVDTRSAMARGAVRRIHAGTSGMEVIELLGNPDQAPFYGKAPRRTTRILLYRLSTTSAAGKSSCFLCVHLDGQDRVITADLNG